MLVGSAATLVVVGVLVLVLGSGGAAQRPRLGSIPPATPAQLAAATTPMGAPAAVSLSTVVGPTISGRMTGLELDLGRGFHFDPRAALPCAVSVARAGECPATSLIGHGSGEIVVRGRYLPRTAYPVDASLYLAPVRRRGDIAGAVLNLHETQADLDATMLGRVVAVGRGHYGIAIEFPNTAAQLPRAYQLTLRRLSATLQSTRTVGTTVHHLLTNPSSCAGSGWPLRLAVVSGGRSWVYRSAATCAKPAA